MPEPAIYLLAGPNGSGKTTLARDFLPQEAKCLNFLNADLLAAGLSPFDLSAGSLRAGRLMLQEFDRNVARNASFAVETTLSGLGYLPRLRRAKACGYEVVIFYVWTGSVELSLERMRQRVAKGGHAVPEADVRRRFHRSVRNFFAHYRALVDSYAVFDNRGDGPVLVAFGGGEKETVLDAQLYAELWSHHEQTR